MRLEIVALDAPVGARVAGIDAAVPPGAVLVDALKRALAEHGCLLLRDQRLDEDQEVAFASAFGETVVPWLHAGESNTIARLKERPGLPIYRGRHPGVVYYVNGPRFEARISPLQRLRAGVRRLRRPRAPRPRASLKPDQWHADMTHLQVPLCYSFLHALEAPEKGYETWYSNQYLAYERLDAATKRRVDGLRIAHGSGHGLPHLIPVVHPLALTHPISGRRAIYGIPGFADRCPLGLSPGEGTALLAAITAHLETGETVYRHAWRAGDLMIWDNRCVLHRRGPEEAGQTRVLRRVMASDGGALAVRRWFMGAAGSARTETAAPPSPPAARPC